MTQIEEAGSILFPTTEHDTLSPKIIKNAHVDLRKQKAHNYDHTRTLKYSQFFIHFTSANTLDFPNMYTRTRANKSFLFYWP